MKCKIKATSRVFENKKTWSLQFQGYRRVFDRNAGIDEVEANLEPHQIQQLANDGYEITPLDLPDLEPLTDRESESWSDPEPEEEPEPEEDLEDDPEPEDEEEFD